MKAILYIFGITTILFFLLDGIGSTNKFGIEINKYKDKISKIEKYWAYNENTNKYSWFTPIRLPDSNISLRIEHLVVANETDISMIPEVTNHRFLMSIVAFETNSFQKIEIINIQNIVNDENLSLSASYLYRKAKNKDYRWEIQKIKHSKPMSKYIKFEAVAYIYPFPEYVETNILHTSKNLFSDAEQTITIIYRDNNDIKKSVQYKFHLDYYLYMSIWDEILTIT